MHTSNTRRICSDVLHTWSIRVILGEPYNFWQPSDDFFTKQRIGLDQTQYTTHRSSSGNAKQPLTRIGHLQQADRWLHTGFHRESYSPGTLAYRRTTRHWYYNTRHTASSTNMISWAFEEDRTASSSCWFDWTNSNRLITEKHVLTNLSATLIPSLNC